MNTKEVLMVNSALKPFYVMVLLGLLLLIQVTSAVPNTGVASLIGSNNFTVTVAGSDGGDTWIIWGGAPGNEIFGSQIQTGDGTFIVYGAPLIGGQTLYYKSCDSTGCDPVEQTLIIPAITPLPTTTFGNAYKNLTARHFSIDSIAPNLLPGYIATGITPTLLWGIMFFFIFFGFWFRTKDVKMVVILGLLMATFIATPIVLGGNGPLGFVLPTMFVLVAQGVMAACIGGILISFIRK
jgi:hypothetical protein